MGKARPDFVSVAMPRIRLTQESVVFALAVAVLVFSLTLHNFLTPGNLIALVRSVSILGILGLGMGLVVIGRGIDLAMVATMVVSVSWVLSLRPITKPPLGWALSWARPFVAIGLISGILIAYAAVPAIFTTLAMGLVIYGVGRAWLFQVDVQNTPDDSALFDFLGRGTFWAAVPIVAFAVLALSSGPAALDPLRPLHLCNGRQSCAARNAGVPLRPMIVAQYVITASSPMRPASSWRRLAGMSTRVYNSTMIYDVLLVVVLGGIGLSGGRGGVRNVLVGTLLIGVLLNGMTILDIPYVAQNLIKSVILLVAIVIDSFINPRDEQTAQQEQGDI